MFEAFSLDLAVRTRVTRRHFVFELALGDGIVALHTPCSPREPDAPGALVAADDPARTARFLANMARALELPAPAATRKIRETPADVGVRFRGRNHDEEQREWLYYRIRAGSCSEADFRVCPELGVARLDERAPADRASFFTALCNTLTEVDVASDRRTDRRGALDWLVDDVPLLYDVTAQETVVRPPHLKWLGSHLVAIEASGRRVVQIEPERLVLFEADKVDEIQRITEHRLMVCFTEAGRERYAVIDMRDYSVEYPAQRLGPDLAWSNGLVFEDVEGGVAIHSRRGTVTYEGIGQAWRAVPPRYILARNHGYYLLDVLDRRGWELAPPADWWAFELNAGVSRAAFATMTGRLFTAAVDRRFLDGALPTRSRSMAIERFWTGVDSDFVTVAGIHTELSVTRLASRYGMPAAKLADRLEARLGEFLALYLPDEWTPAGVKSARFDLAPAWGEALERGIALPVVQVAAERLAFRSLARRLDDDAFVDMLVRGGRPIGPQDLDEFDRCIAQASELFLSKMPDTDGDSIATEVQLHVRQASDSLRLLATRQLDVEPAKWDTVRSRMQRFPVLARHNAPPTLGQRELLHLARDVDALA